MNAYKKHLYRHFNGGHLIEDRIPGGMQDVEYLGYVTEMEYDGVKYRTFVSNRNFPSQRLMPTQQELWKYGI